MWQSPQILAQKAGIATTVTNCHLIIYIIKNRISP